MSKEVEQGISRKGIAQSRLRNAAADFADEIHRCQRQRERFKRTLDEARVAGLSDADLLNAIGEATKGSTRRTLALESYAAGELPL